MRIENNPIVSICIPAYRGEQHLSLTIESVLKQRFTDFELIIINDNSPDKTEEIISTFNDPRIRYFRNAVNLGPKGNWDRCLQEARGQYFKLLPQDDLLYPDTIGAQVEILEQDRNQSIALVFGSRNIIDSDGKIIMRRGYPSRRVGVIPANKLIRSCIRSGTNLIGEPGGILMRRSLTEIVGAFDDDVPYVIDLDYWARLLQHGDGYYMVGPVSAFRISVGSWSVAIGGRQSEEYRRFIAKTSKNKKFDIKTVDVFLGNQQSRLNNLLRLILYRFYLTRGKRHGTI